VPLKRLSPRVYAWVGAGGGTNAGVIIGDRGVAVVDALLTPTAGRNLRERIRAVTSLPVRFLVNTHYHGDHTFGNQAFAPEAVVIGHRRAREGLLRLGAEQLDFFRRRQPLLAAEFDRVRLTPPDLTIDQGCTLHLGGLEVELRYVGPAHTDGDLVVWVPGEGVLFTGDLVFNGWFPTASEADIDGWVRALAELGRYSARIVVPGHGPPGGPEVMATLQEYFETVRAGVAAARARGLSAEEAIAAVGVGGLGEWQGRDRHAGLVRRLWAELTTSRPG
jgi:cyclase